MTVEIVPIAESHAEGLNRAFGAVARERLYLARLEAPPIEGTRAFVRANIERRNPQFVVLDGGEVVGWCDIVRSVRASEAHSGQLGMGLLAAYRDRGIGTALLAETLRAAQAAGMTRVELTVRVENTRAVALYEKAGFATEGRLRNAGRIDGEYHDVFVMAKLFDDPA